MSFLDKVNAEANKTKEDKKNAKKSEQPNSVTKSTKAAVVPKSKKIKKVTTKSAQDQSRLLTKQSNSTPDNLGQPLDQKISTEPARDRDSAETSDQTSLFTNNEEDEALNVPYSWDEDDAIAHTQSIPDVQDLHPDDLQRKTIELRIFADAFYSIQRHRIAEANRLNSEAIPKDIVKPILDDIKHAEELTGKAMRKAFRRAFPEVAEWVTSDAAIGIGEHLTARLLGAIGHPLHAIPHHWEGEGERRQLITDEPFDRTFRQLASYSGVGDPERKRRRGMTAEDAIALGNPRAKMILRIMAEGTIKLIGEGGKRFSVTESTSDAQETIPPNGNGKTRIKRRSPYRDVYDEYRERYDAKVDEDGKPWTPLHSHNAALRIVARRILKDIYSIYAGPPPEEVK